MFFFRVFFYDCLGDSDLCKCQGLKFVKILNKRQ